MSLRSSEGGKKEKLKSGKRKRFDEEHYVCMHICMYICMYVCVYACMGVCVDLCVYVCIVCTCVCVPPTYVRIYVYMNT